MKRYVRLYLYFLRFSFSKALEFRMDFTFKILMDCIYYCVNILFFQIIYNHTHLVAGWNLDEMMLFVSSFLVVDAITMTVFSTNLWWLPILINKGDLDYYLIRPVSPLFFLSLREFSANSFVNLIIALSFFFYTVLNTSIIFSLYDFILLILLLVNGALIYYCIKMLMVIPVFWTQSARGFSDLFYSLAIMIERPDKIFKGWLRFLFTIVIPFCLVASYPAKIFIEKEIHNNVIHIFFVSIGLWIVMIFLWNRGLKSYSSASS